ncbi:MAG: Clp protease N-terminal domain-containing protein [Ktedonobacteraceae bacterium]
MSSRDRFDKFTERARKVLQYAQEEAQRFQHNYIGTEHLLLGLLRVEDSVAAKVLANLGVEILKARGAVEFIIGRGDRLVLLGEIGLTPRAKKVIELAVDEARHMHHRYIGTEHLLLGMIREGEGIAAGVLESLGVNLEKVRTETIRVLSQRPDAQDKTLLVEEDGEVVEQESYTFTTPAEIIAPYKLGSSDLTGDTGKLNKFTADSRRALAFAQEEAQLLQHSYIGTEHLLLGLLRANWTMAAQILQRLGIDLHKTRGAVESIIGRGDRIVLGEIGLTPHAKKVIALAIDEASRLGHSIIGTEHILLGIVREGEGIAVGVIESLGVTGQKVREKTLQQLRGQQDS